MVGLHAGWRARVLSARRLATRPWPTPGRTLPGSPSRRARRPTSCSIGSPSSWRRRSRRCRAARRAWHPRSSGPRSPRGAATSRRRPASSSTPARYGPVARGGCRTRRSGPGRRRRHRGCRGRPGDVGPAQGVGRPAGPGRGDRGRRGNALLVLGRLGPAADAYRASGQRLGRLALVEALQGELRAARALADRALAGPEPGELLRADRVGVGVRRGGGRRCGTGTPAPDGSRGGHDGRPGDRGRPRVAGGSAPSGRGRPGRGARRPRGAVRRTRLARGPLRARARSARPGPGRPSDALARHASLSDPTRTGAEHLLWQVRLAEWAQRGSHDRPADPGTPLVVRVERLLLEASRRLSLGETRRGASGGAARAQPRGSEQLRRPFREATADVRRLLLDDGALRPAGRRPALRRCAAKAQRSSGRRTPSSR